MYSYVDMYKKFKVRNWAKNWNETDKDRLELAVLVSLHSTMSSKITTHSTVCY